MLIDNLLDKFEKFIAWCKGDDAICDEKFTDCLDTSLNDAVGGNFGWNRCSLCSLCRETCIQNGGSWPSRSHTGDRCDYWNF